MAMMAVTRFEASFHRNKVLTVPWPGLTPNHFVFASASEAGPQDKRFTGGARITVHNVAPQAGHAYSSSSETTICHPNSEA